MVLTYFKSCRIFATLLPGALFVFIPHVEAQTTVGSGLKGSALITFIQQNYTPNAVLGYNAGRDSMYASVDNVQDSLECVYTGFKIPLKKSDGVPRTVAFDRGINAEHTWPQSFFNEASPMVSDLHHLFPTEIAANGLRSNHPFAEIADNLTTSWLINNTVTATTPALSVRDAYSEYYSSTFEPRESHKGNVARAVFYFWSVYQNTSAILNDETDNESFFTGMLPTLYDWHYADPADAAELARTNKIAGYQGNTNPFVLDSTLARRAFYPTEDPEPEPEPPVRPDSTYAGAIIISQYFEGASNNKFIEITNVSRFSVNLDSDSLFLCLFANPTGSLAGVNPTNSVRITGTIASGASLLFKNGSSALPAYAVTAGTTQAVCNFNGNDPILLTTRSKTAAWANRVDVFGLTTGATFAADISYFRKTSVVRANANYDETEWTSATLANVESAGSNATAYLGFHEKPDVYVFGGTAGFRLISIPNATVTMAEFLAPIWTQGATGADVSHGSASVYTWNAASAQYSAVTNLNTTLSRGTGLAVYFFADANNDGLDDAFPRVLGHGVEEDANAYAPTISNAHQGWNLVGNPFREALDWDHAGVSKTNLNNSVYIWNSEENTYGVWNGLTGTGGQNGVIGAGQAFWVKSTGANPALTLHGTAKNGFRGLFKPLEYPEIRLRTGNSETVLVFSHLASAGPDEFDAEWLQPMSVDWQALTSLDANGKRFTIQAVAPIAEPISFSIERLSTSDGDFSVEMIKNATEYRAEISKTGEKLKSRVELGPAFQQSELFSQLWTLQLTPKTVSNEQQRPAGAVLRTVKAFPNPFNPETTLELQLGASSAISIQILDLSGRMVDSVLRGTQPAGTFRHRFQAKNLASGVYLARISAGNEIRQIKLVLVK